MCMAYGDRHYRTFDGLLFDYVGACKVYLVKVLKVFLSRKSSANFKLFICGRFMFFWAVGLSDYNKK